MGTDLLLQLLADRAAPIREDVASTARVQAMTAALSLRLVMRALARLGQIVAWRFK
jgi:hypothetical protein